MKSESFIYVTDLQEITLVDQLKENGCVGIISPNQEIRSTLESFSSVKEAFQKTKAKLLWFGGSRKIAKKSLSQAIDVGFKKIILSKDDLPIRDLMEIKKEAKKNKCLILGPDAGGIYQHGKMIASFPKDFFQPGYVAILSRSKSLGLALVDLLKENQMGVSQFYGLGSSELALSEYSDFLPKLEKDEKTKAIVIIGSIGGDFEQKAALMIKKNANKPLFFYLAGKKLLTHTKQPAILTVFKEQTLEDKQSALLKAGAHKCQTLFEIPKQIQKIVEKK